MPTSSPRLVSTFLAASLVLPASAGAQVLAAEAGSSPARPLAQGSAAESPVRVLEGLVLAPDGGPAAGAVVVSNAGGHAVTDATGRFRLEVAVGWEATELGITAVGAGGGELLASQRVPLSATSLCSWTGSLRLSSGTCASAWLPTFGPEPGANGPIHAFLVFDDGNGPALYAGGGFTSIAGVPANRIARWDGTAWSPLGSGLTGLSSIAVQALAVFDDGTGPALYAGGHFGFAGGVPTSGIARWDGTTWSALGSEGVQGAIFALASFDDGTGPALYAGGAFPRVDGVSVNHVAKWNGSSWSPLDIGATDVVRALTVFDDGTGAALYAGGDFQGVGDAKAPHIARWNGSVWTALDSSVVSLDVHALTVFDDGNGEALYAAGTFGFGATAAVRIARWDGTSWSRLADGLGAPGEGPVLALSVFDDGGGAALYAGGYFTVAGTTQGVHRVARWDGTSWTSLGSGVGSSSSIWYPMVQALGVFDAGGGPALFVGGDFDLAGGVGANCLARWDGTGWSAFGSGVSHRVVALAVFDDGSGPALYAGGDMRSVGGMPVKNIARWDGSSWTPLLDGVEDSNASETVKALAVYDDGTGPALYVAGTFTRASGIDARRIAKWDGTSWSPLGNGLDGHAYALAVHDDGTGPELYVGGLFLRAGNQLVNRIAKWNGSRWAKLGQGESNSLNSSVNSLAVFDDGTGAALYASGGFTPANGFPGNKIAKWDGANWSSIGSGPAGGSIGVLATYSDHRGPALYAGGSFTSIDGVAAVGIARWDGTSWAALGGGTGPGPVGVDAMSPYDDGSGTALFVAGSFPGAGGQTVTGVARWNGFGWSSIGGGITGSVADLEVFDAGAGPHLYAGGDFSSALDSGDSHLARWAGAGCDVEPPILSGPESVRVLDPVGSSPGEVVTFSVTAIDLLDGPVAVVCAPPSGSVFPPGRTQVVCTATDAAGNQASFRFQVLVVQGIH